MPRETALRRLEGLLTLAAQAGADDVVARVRSLIDRVHEGRFFVACLGQFKRGKSTLINALVGDAVLPTGVAPVTSAVTVVRYGERRCRVRFGPSDWREVPVQDLRLYVSEADNPDNAKGVTAVEVFCPSPLLDKGLCLVDTPGIGSVFASNTEETRSFVPQIDAAVVVLGGDPPISGDELALIDEVREHVQDLIFVLNKADRLRPAELEEVRSFTRSVLGTRRPAPPAVFEISALEHLDADGPPRDWPLLLRELDRLARASGAELVDQAASRGADQLSARLRRELVETRDALQCPIEDSERRLKELKRCAATAEQSLVELTHLFNAEQNKLERRLADDRKRFVENAAPRAAALVAERLAGAPIRRGPGLRRRALELAQQIAEERVAEWMTEERPIAEREFAAVTHRFVTHANQFLERLRESGELPPESLPEMLVAETGLRARSRYHFHSFMTLTSPSLWTWMADWFRTSAGARASAERAAGAFAKRLIDANANRVIGDLDERVTESRRSVEGALRRRLQDVVASAENAARRASQVRDRGADAVRDELQAVETRVAELTRLGRQEGGA